MLAVGNDDLGEEVKEGDLVYNPVLEIKGVVNFGVDVNGVKTNLLCGVAAKKGSDYLCGVSGRLIYPWKLVKPNKATVDVLHTTITPNPPP